MRLGINLFNFIFISILMFLGCSSTYLMHKTQQDIQKSALLLPDMSKKEVEEIMGLPIKTEFSDNFTAWHYCRTGTGSDEFVVVIFENDRVRVARNYMVTLAETGGVTGDCSKFIRPVDFNAISSKRQKIEQQEVKKTGTAWLLDSGYVVTNQHVIDGADSFKIIDNSKREISLELVAQDRANDIAILWANELSSVKGIPISNSYADIGSEVFTIGYPHPDILGSAVKLSSGIVNSQTGLLDDPRTYQISIPLQSGNSGGPLINMYGEVVGIVTSKLDAIEVFKWSGDFPENVSYAIKIKYLCLLIEESAKIICSDNRKTQKQTIEEMGKNLESKVFYIIAK
jgi:S1-C subfamily serine protease